MTNNESVKYDLGETTAIETESHFWKVDEKKVVENTLYIANAIKKWKQEPGNEREKYFVMRSKKSPNYPDDKFFDDITVTLEKQGYYCSKAPISKKDRLFYVSLDPFLSV